MITAEEIVIATILNDVNTQDDIFALLNVNHFEDAQNMAIYAKMKELHAKHISVDLVTITPHIQQQSLHYLLDITSKVGYAANYLQHVAILQDRYTRMKLQSVANTIILECADKSKAIDDILIMSGKLLNEINATEQPIITSLGSDIPQTLERISDAKAHREKTGLSYTGIDTGISALNMRNTGWQPETLTVIAARPGMGKTAFMLWSAEAAAKKGMVLIFSLEMSKTQLLKRAISGKSGVEYKRLTNGNISDIEFKKIMHGSESLMDSNIYIDDTSGIHVDTLTRTCRKIAKKHKIVAVFIDYLQLLRGEGNNREQEIGYISRNLKGLSKQIYAPVICLAQLNRANESRSDKRPILADLRDSGQIEQDADDIIMLYREEYYTAVPPEEAGNIEFITRKCRNGESGTDVVKVDLAHNTFYEYDQQQKRPKTFNDDDLF